MRTEVGGIGKFAEALADQGVAVDLIIEAAEECGVDVDYIATCEDGGGGEEDIDIDSPADAEDAWAEWIRRGDWGDLGDGCTIEGYYTVLALLDGARLQLGERESASVCLLPAEPACPEADEHDWSSEHEGGCDDNPGVWSLGGTAMKFRSHCLACGMSRTERTTGPQRNPGDSDTVVYGDPDPDWVAAIRGETD